MLFLSICTVTPKAREDIDILSLCSFLEATNETHVLCVLPEVVYLYLRKKYLYYVFACLSLCVSPLVRQALAYNACLQYLTWSSQQAFLEEIDGLCESERSFWVPRWGWGGRKQPGCEIRSCPNRAWPMHDVMSIYVALGRGKGPQAYCGSCIICHRHLSARSLAMQV